METALYILHVIVCLTLLPVILLQSGKGGGVSSMFGGGGSGSVFGSRGASTFLTKLTTGSAIVFMCTSMGLSYISSRSRSVVPTDVAPAEGTVKSGDSDKGAAPAAATATKAK